MVRSARFRARALVLFVAFCGGAALVFAEPRIPREPAISPAGKAPTLGVSVDPKFPRHGQYLKQLVERVEFAWEKLIDQSDRPAPSGGAKVLIAAKLNSRGEMKDLRLLQGDANAWGTRLCLNAISTAAPFGPWSEDMVRDLGRSRRSPSLSNIRRPSPLELMHAASFAPPRRILALTALLILPLLPGCISHEVAVKPKTYEVAREDNAARGDTTIWVVLAPETLAQKYAVQSWTTGIANKWEAEPGQILKEMVAIEFPQAFGRAEIIPAYAEPTTGRNRLTVELTLVKYEFTSYRAKVDVRAVAYRAGRVVAFEKSYHADGATQGAKMFWGGAFGMKSAMRTSSLDAYKQVFSLLRIDINQALGIRDVTI